MAANLLCNSLKLLCPLTRAGDLKIVSITTTTIPHLKVRLVAGMVPNGQRHLAAKLIGGKCAEVGDQVTHDLRYELGFDGREETHSVKWPNDPRPQAERPGPRGAWIGNRRAMAGFVAAHG